MEWIYHAVRHFLSTWGYWAVLIGLLGENAGLPLPGETVLMFASFLAHKGTDLELRWIIVTGIGAAVLGDNTGFLIGRKLGSTLIRWMKKLLRMNDEDVGAAKDMFKRHGAATIFFARFIFGMRTIAGPLAGVLDMEWKEFLLFNFLGATTWVTVISFTGYLFANEFQTLLDYIEDLSWVMAAGLFSLAYYLWRRQKSKYKERKKQHEAA
jgi:membrane-associated protein